MRTIEAESIEVVFSGGLGRSSEEASEMEVERRTGAIRSRTINNRGSGRIYCD
jgi:hypothetical protein